MNILGFVFSMLLIFACTFSLSARKAYLCRSIQQSYLEHVEVTRKMRSSYESICYKRLRRKRDSKAEPAFSLKKKPLPQPTGQLCARLNLWPLLENHGKASPFYEAMARSLRSLYQELLQNESANIEYLLLEELLEIAKCFPQEELIANAVPLEKLQLSENLAHLYYQMLKGLHNHYPSFLDCFLMSSDGSNLCLQHASLEILCSLLGPKSAEALYTALQEENELSQEEILSLVPAELLYYVSLKAPHFADQTVVLLQQGAQVRLKKRVSLYKKST